MAEKQEIWRKIDDYPNYEVSSEGRVRNVKTGRILKFGKVSSGYLTVGLCLGSKIKYCYVHRLVATAFIPNLDNKKEVNHISGIKTDNRMSNLEWSTRSENILHAYRTGLKFHSGKTGKPKQKIRCIETGQIFESQYQASKYFGCGQGSIQVSINKGCVVLKKYHFELIS